MTSRNEHTIVTLLKRKNCKSSLERDERDAFFNGKTMT